MLLPILIARNEKIWTRTIRVREDLDRHHSCTAAVPLPPANLARLLFEP